MQGAVIDLLHAQRFDVECIVLVQLPRTLRALFWELIKRALEVARCKVHIRFWRDRRIVVDWHARAQTGLVHMVQHATQILTCEIGLERPGGIGVSKTGSEVGNIGVHHSLVLQAGGNIDAFTIHDDLEAAEGLQVEPGCRHDQISG